MNGEGMYKEVQGNSVDVFNASLSKIVAMSAEVADICQRVTSFLIGAKAATLSNEAEAEPEPQGWIRSSTDELAKALHFLRSALELLGRLQQDGILIPTKDFNKEDYITEQMLEEQLAGAEEFLKIAQVAQQQAEEK